MRLDSLFSLFLLSIPFWIPAGIGLYLLANRRNKLSLMAGLLTWKPIFTTPLWLLIIDSLQGRAVGAVLIALYSILPGASLTVLALVIFRCRFYGPMEPMARKLIVLDCMRWINSGLFTCTGFLIYNQAITSLVFVFGLIGLFFPTVYSVVALTTILATNER